MICFSGSDKKEASAAVLQTRYSGLSHSVEKTDKGDSVSGTRAGTGSQKETKTKEIKTPTITRIAFF